MEFVWILLACVVGAVVVARATIGPVLSVAAGQTLSPVRTVAIAVVGAALGAGAAFAAVVVWLVDPSRTAGRAVEHSRAGVAVTRVAFESARAAVPWSWLAALFVVILLTVAVLAAFRARSLAARRRP